MSTDLGNEATQDLQRRQVGERVRHARKSLGWSQAALARTAGVSENTIDSIENAKHRTQPEKLRKVLDALQLAPLGDTRHLRMNGVPADAQTFLAVVAARLAAISDEKHRAVLLARAYPIFFVDDTNRASR